MRESAARIRHSTISIEEFRDDLRVVGKVRRRVDGVKLVAGMKAYVEDRVEQGSCTLVMLRNPHAHAKIRGIDIAAALALPGIVTVITHLSCPDVMYTFPARDSPSRRRTTSACSVPSCVTSGTGWLPWLPRTRRLPVRRQSSSRSTMKFSPAALTMDDAMANGAPVVHGDHLERITCELSIGSDARRNLAASASGSIGDVDRGFAEADAVVERTYSTSKVQCTPLESHVVYTRMDGDRLVIHASTQVPWHLRRIVAGILGIRENRIRVIKERIGGGYGSKQDILLEDVCAWATFTTGRAVFYKYNREEEFIAATTRHPIRYTVKMGAKKDGTLTAIRLTGDADTGAFGNHALTVPMNSCSKSLPLWRCPNMAFDLRSWYTNVVSSGAYQGYGAPQGSFAVQMAAAELAAALGIDLLAFIRKNHVRQGDVLEILKSLGEGRPGRPSRWEAAAWTRRWRKGPRASAGA